MAIIISKNRKNAVKVEKSSFALEDNLQQYIYDNPESIPLYDIKEDIRLLILAREFQTSSGPIDAIGIDRDGEIYLVETKLYRNPDKRTVVAQVLDYGASLWKTYTSTDAFISRLESYVIKQFRIPLQEKIKSFFNMSDEEMLHFNESLRDNLNDGNFKFVVLMDEIHNQLKDLIMFINQNSRFNIYGVELEYYKYENHEILIPKLFGAEVKKDVATKKYDNTLVSDEEFVSIYKTIGLENIIQEVLSLLRSMQNGEIKVDGWAADRTPKNINFFYKAPNETRMSLVISVGYNHEIPSQMFDFWLYDKVIEKKVLIAIRDLFKIESNMLKPDAKYGIVARWPIKEFTKEKLTVFFSAVEAT
ncbi:MAG: hypothetical protein Q7R97_04075 [Candidatus Daviesbacteria bacterium]|nr:hypothetical protein [Candidatus Daviesbacteria bacterium]